MLRMALALSVALASPAGAAVLLSEIDYDQPGTDTAEWVELHNPDAVPMPLTNLELVGVNGSGCTEYFRIDLDPIVIPANGYVVIGQEACATPLVSFPGTTNQIQNGAPDVIYIQDRTSGNVLDSVEYENPGPSACGFTPTPATDTPTVPGSIQRCPSGWVFSVATPCGPNDCTVAVEETSWGLLKVLFR